MKFLKRFSIAFLFALMVSAATYMLAQARTEPSQPVQPQEIGCFMCHPKFDDSLQAGAHGHAFSDPAFTQMWKDQGKPGACLVCHVTGYDPASGSWTADGVSCEACHGPVPAEHTTNPVANPVSIDRSSDLCGRCHSGDRFNLQEWQTSTHFQRAMTCTVCHDPHSAALKTVEGQEETGPSALCINCHSEVSMAFPYSKHNQAGVSCVECHLLHFQTGPTDVHAIPDHSFTASIAVCSSCHADQMHSQPTADASATQVEPTSQPESTTKSGEVASNPSPVNPLGFAGLAGLLGLAGGMVLQPWLDKTYQKMNKKGPNK